MGGVSGDEQYGSPEEYWGGFWPDAGQNTGGAPPVDRVNWTQYPGHGPGAEFLGTPRTALELGSATCTAFTRQVLCRNRGCRPRLPLLQGPEGLHTVTQRQFCQLRGCIYTVTHECGSVVLVVSEPPGPGLTCWAGPKTSRCGPC